MTRSAARQTPKRTAAGDGAVASGLQGLRPGQSLELLKELHIVTPDGRINQDSRRKLKQVLHLYQLIEKPLQELLAGIASSAPAAVAGLSIVDHGAGKSYLGFILYDLFLRHQPAGWIFGVETRSELVLRSRALATRLGFDRMSFVNLSVAQAGLCDDLPARVDVVTALHACDTATDDAIAFGLAKQAQTMVLVPCCQAELARKLNAGKAISLARTPLAELWRHPLHTREMGSQLTNVLRCLYLEACGYQVTVTELVGWEHSLKNELILARFTGKTSLAAGQRLVALLGQFGLLDLLQSRFCRLAGPVAVDGLQSGWGGAAGGVFGNALGQTTAG